MIKIFIKKCVFAILSIHHVTVYFFLHICARACVRVRVRMRACACVRVCVCVYMCVCVQLFTHELMRCTNL